MATEFVLQTLLSSVPQSLRTMYAHWLSADERARHADERVLLYLGRTRDAAARARAMAGLGADARALLARIVKDEDKAPAGDIMARVAAEGFTVSPNTLAELHCRGLAFIDDAAFWPGTKAAWSAAHACQPLVTPPGLQAAAPPTGRGTIALPPPARGAHPLESGDAVSLAAQLGEFVHAAARGALRITQSGAFASRARAALAPMAAHNSLIGGGWSDHLLAFARASGLVRVDGTGCVVPARRLSLFRQKTSAEQMHSLLEFSALHIVEPEELNARCGFAARRFVLDTMRTALASADQAGWYPLPGLGATVARQAAPLFSARGQKKQWHWLSNTCAAPTRRLWTTLVAEMVEGWFVPGGVLERGTDDHGVPCVRVTSFGRFWLTGDTATLQEGRRSRLVVQTDFTAVLTHSGSWDRVAQILSFFASRSGDDNASIFTFDRDHVRAALRQGHLIDELVATLDAHSAYPVPPNVRATLRGWATISSPAVLYRDVNLFSFDTGAERDAFMDSLHDTRARRIGTRHVLSLLPENLLLDVMQRVHAVPVDYTHPPVAGIEIMPDGRVISQALDDLRVRALVEAIALPLPGAPGCFRLSASRAANVKNPEDMYDQLVRLPGKPLQLAVRLFLLMTLGVLEPSTAHCHAVLEGLTPAERRRLKSAVRWRTVLAAQAGKDLWVLKPGCADTVRAALVAAKSRATVSDVDMQDMPPLEPASSLPSRVRSPRNARTRPASA